MTLPEHVTPGEQFRHYVLNGASHLLKNCVQPSSNAKYANDWQHYLRFWAYFSPPPNDDPDSMFLLCMPPNQRVMVLIAFLFFAHTHLHLKARTINGTMSGIRHHFRAVTPTYMDVFHHPSVTAAKTAIALAERTTENYVPPKRKLPLTGEMTLFIAQQLARAQHMTDRMTNTAVLLAYFCLLRVSEYVPDSKAEVDDNGAIPHFLKARDVEFELAPLAGESPRDPTLIPAHQVKAALWPRVTAVKFTLRSMKNDTMRIGSVFWFQNLAQSEGTNIVRVVFDWAVAARHKRMDPFMSFNLPSGGHVRLTYNRVNRCIKDCALAFGLPEKDYGTHSARIGGASILRAGGAPDSMVQLLGRWRDINSVFGYQAPSISEFDAMQRLLMAPWNFTTRDLRLTRLHAPHLSG